ncbi:GerMN domain-containing protein [Streptomyces sp. NPDC001478]
MRIVRQGLLAAALGIALMACGVRPTGVIGAGEPASGLTRGMRLYYVASSGLRPVPLIDREIGPNIGGVLKLLLDPPEGLVNLLQLGGYTVSVRGARVTVEIDGSYGGTGRDLGTGQLVCTLASARSVSAPGIDSDEVEVVLSPSQGPEQGPYRCADYFVR